jgi:two-component system, chemotaxis family, chemotaxis protein CheY
LHTNESGDDRMATGLAALRLLVIDDNKQMRTIVGSVLLAAGARHIHYAPDGRSGLDVLAEQSIDVVYVDYEMPAMNGLDFISAVRRLTTSAQYMPIIMLTGHSDRQRLDAARDRGVTEFLCKPVTARAILTRLDAVIMNPRPFVQSPDYFGPCRRRTRQGFHEGPLRRSSDTSGVVEL